jgi:hypothetical protein
MRYPWGKSALLYLQFSTDGSDILQLNNLLHRQDLAKRLEAINARLDIDVRKDNSVLECRIVL